MNLVKCDNHEEQAIRPMAVGQGYCGVRGFDEPQLRKNVWKVQRALEDAGVIFIDENDEGPGVQLKK